MLWARGAGLGPRHMIGRSMDECLSVLVMFRVVCSVVGSLVRLAQY